MVHQHASAGGGDFHTVIAGSTGGLSPAAVWGMGEAAPHARRGPTADRPPNPLGSLHGGGSAVGAHLAQDYGKKWIFPPPCEGIWEFLLLWCPPPSPEYGGDRSASESGCRKAALASAGISRSPKGSPRSLLFNSTPTYNVSLYLKLPALISAPHMLFFIAWDCPSVKQQLSWAWLHQRQEAAFCARFSTPLPEINPRIDGRRDVPHPGSRRCKEVQESRASTS